jgi:hypothetical protein
LAGLLSIRGQKPRALKDMKMYYYN